MRGDLNVKGFTQTLPRRIAASATRYEVGEPLMLDGATLSSGVASVNTWVLAAPSQNTLVIIGTDTFGGVAITGAIPHDTGTLVAHTTITSNPVSWLGKIESRATTPGNIDTAAELLGVIGDVAFISYNATGGSDGGELYTIAETATLDTASFTIVEGDIVKGLLSVTIDGRAYRIGNDIT